jgi:hypothetical protein
MWGFFCLYAIIMPMASWSQRRKLLYGGITVVVLAAAVFLPAFFFFYKAPTCFDGARNGDETGVDCGGSCQRFCPSAFLAPNVAWTRLEQVAPGLYNVAAYIINPNPKAGASAVPYHVIIYDNAGIEITEYDGTVTLPPQRNTLAFNGAVSTGKRIPAKALFQFTASPDWVVRIDPLTAISVGDKKYSEDSSSASLSVTLKNTGVDPLGHMSVYAVLYDKDGNALGFSKTILDGISGQSSVVAPFTWPTSWNGSVISIEVLPVAE